MPQDASRLIWIDLEMTGLDPDTDSVLEIATLVTDANLEVLAEGPSLAIRHPLVEKYLWLFDDEIVSEIAAIHVVISHRAVMLMHEAVGDGSCIPGGGGRVDRMERCRRGAEARQPG